MDEEHATSAVRSRRLVLAVQDPTGHPLAAGPITELLSRLKGIHYAYVSTQTEMAWLIYNPACFDLTEAVGALAALGYTAGPPEPRSSAAQLSG